MIDTVLVGEGVKILVLVCVGVKVVVGVFVTTRVFVGVLVGVLDEVTVFVGVVGASVSGVVVPHIKATYSGWSINGFLFP